MNTKRPPAVEGAIQTTMTAVPRSLKKRRERHKLQSLLIVANGKQKSSRKKGRWGQNNTKFPLGNKSWMRWKMLKT
jgi:hypothetical protein